jgi:hypothetical protein
VGAVACQRYPRLVLPIASTLLVTAFLPALCNDSRPLLLSGKLRHPDGKSVFLRSRTDLYFTEEGSLAATYIPAAEAIRKEACTDIGLDESIKPNSHDYALVALARVPQRNSNFRYIGVHNLSTKYAKPADLRPPCLVVCFGCLARSEKWAEYSAALPQTQVFGDITIFSDDSGAPGTDGY